MHDFQLETKRTGQFSAVVQYTEIVQSYVTSRHIQCSNVLECGGKKLTDSLKDGGGTYL